MYDKKFSKLKEEKDIRKQILVDRIKKLQTEINELSR
jgi:hypothetical protein